MSNSPHHLASQVMWAVLHAEDHVLTLGCVACPGAPGDFQSPSRGGRRTPSAVSPVPAHRVTSSRPLGVDAAHRIPTY